MKPHVLDANALYRYFKAGPGAPIVRQLMRDALFSNQRLMMSALNWGEVYYTIARNSGYREADRMAKSVDRLPLMIVNVDRAQAEEAGRIKAGYGLPYADCFAAALAGKTGVLVTADLADFKKVPWLKTVELPVK